MTALLLAPLGAIAGALIGSFLATLILRWPNGRQATRGRSRCDYCDRPLTPIELIPLMSRWMLGNRCRSCRQVIDPLHLRVETAAATVGAVAILIAPDWTGVALAIFGWLLIPLCWLDWRHFWLPNHLTLLLASVGLLGGAALGAPLADQLIGGLIGFGSLTALNLAYRRLRGRDGLGAGDAKLFGAIGLWVGWALLAPILALAAALGLMLGLRRGLGATGAIPFGSMLATASWFGMTILIAAR